MGPQNSVSRPDFTVAAGEAATHTCVSAYKVLGRSQLCFCYPDRNIRAKATHKRKPLIGDSWFQMIRIHDCHGREYGSRQARH